MAEFYVEKIAQSNGEHVVHKSDCSLLPSHETLQYLGAISNCDSALKKAGQFYRQVNGCAHCSVSYQAS
ncbi:MAG: hypothetical protein ACU837_01970 [Gammaproteobacteria bacterium]